MWVTLSIFWTFFFHTEVLKMWIYCKTRCDTSRTAWPIEVRGCGSLLPQVFLFTCHFTPYRATLIKSTCWKSRVATSLFSVGCQQFSELVKLKRIGRKWPQPIFKIFVLLLLPIRKSQYAPSNVLHFVVEILINCLLNKVTRFSTTATSSMQWARFLDVSLIVSDSKQIYFLWLSWRSIEHTKIRSWSYIFDKRRRSLLHHISW